MQLGLNTNGTPMLTSALKIRNKVLLVHLNLLFLFSFFLVQQCFIIQA